MKKVYCNRIIKAVALLLPIVLFWISAELVLFKRYDDNSDRFRRFYNEEQNSLDVVLLGASEVLAGYSPGYAYGEHGFTSYAYVMDGNAGSLYEAQLREVLSCQEPQLVVVDVFGFIKGSNEALIDDARMRIFAESIPRTKNWLDIVLNYPTEDRASHFLPFLKNHAHLGMVKDNLTAALTDPSYWHQKEPSRLKGMVTVSSIYCPDNEGIKSECEEKHRLHKDAVPYLVDFLECCKENQLDQVVFVNFPRAVYGEEAHCLLSPIDDVEEIVNSYGYLLVNFHNMKDEIGIDDNTDFYNSHHLNVYGQMKMTSYLGRVLIDDYHLIPMKQSNESKARWEESARCTQLFFDMVNQAIKDGLELTFCESCEQWNSWERDQKKRDVIKTQ